MSIPRVLAIAPNRGVAQAIRNVSENRSDVMVDIKTGDLEDGLKQVMAVPEDAYDMILSRGGTAQLIAAHVSKPVIEIKPGLADLLRAIRLGNSCSSKLAILAFPNITAGVESIADLLSLEMKVVNIRHANEVRNALTALKQEGYLHVLGDTVTVRLANEMQMNGIFISSGVESVMKALNDCVSIFSYLESTQKKMAIMKQILELESIHFLFSDLSGNEIMSSLNNEERQLLSTLNTSAPRSQSSHSVHKMEHAMYLVNNTQLGNDSLSGTAWTVQKKAVWDDDIIADRKTISIRDHAGKMQSILQRISLMIQCNHPLVLLAEKGIFTQNIFEDIQLFDSVKGIPCLQFDMRSLNEKAFNRLLKNPDSPLNDIGYVIFMEHAESLTEDMQKRMISYMSTSELFQRNRLILSFEEASISSSILYKYLTDESMASLVRVPPLRERIEDIPTLVTQITSRYNYRYAKDIVGYTPQALNLLVHFSWPENTQQMFRVIKQLVMTCQGDLIQGENVKMVLDTEIAPAVPMQSTFPLDGTLESMTSRLVRMVLAEEKMNKSKTAERLGIGRSTLWRILQEDK